jgi:hypothetical protein
MDEAALIRDMGTKPKALLASCTNEVASIRAQLSQVHRRLTLAPLSSAPFFQPSLSRIPGDFLDFVFGPIELPSFSGLAQFTQNTGFLITFVVENPHLFAKAVLASVKSSSFQFLVNCTVPAVFGYFTSDEQFSVACRFYASIIENSHASTCISVLRPFLRSGATFRFLESAFGVSLRLLIIQVNCSPNDGQQGYVSGLTSFLVKSIVGAAPLLPQGILDLFRMIRRSNWTQAKINELLFDAFLWPSAIQWILVSAGARHAAVLQLVLDAIVRDQSQVGAIVDRLLTCKSICGIPPIYACFGQKFLDISLCVHDIHVLVKALAKLKLVPETVTRSELNRPAPELEFSVFSCQIFPRGLPPVPAIPELRILTDNSPEAAVFERFLTFAHHKRVLLKWVEISLSQENVVVSPIIARATANPPPGSFLEQFAALRAMLNVQRLSRRIYLGLLDSRLETTIVEGLSNVLDLIDEEFRRTLRDFPERAGAMGFSELTASLRPIVRPMLVEAVRRFACLDCANMHERLRILLQSMLMLMQIQKLEGKPDVICPVIFQQNKGKRLLSTFLILNNFGMKQDVFSSLCTDLEKRIWVKLESTILIVLRADEPFLRAYIALNEEIADLAAGVLV